MRALESCCKLEHSLLCLELHIGCMLEITPFPFLKIGLCIFLRNALAFSLHLVVLALGVFNNWNSLSKKNPSNKTVKELLERGFPYAGIFVDFFIPLIGRHTTDQGACTTIGQEHTNPPFELYNNPQSPKHSPHCWSNTLTMLHVSN